MGPWLQKDDDLLLWSAKSGTPPRTPPATPAIVRARRRIVAHGESAATGYRRGASRVLGLLGRDEVRKAVAEVHNKAAEGGRRLGLGGSGPSRQLGLPRLGGTCSFTRLSDWFIVGFWAGLGCARSICVHPLSTLLLIGQILPWIGFTPDLVLTDTKSTWFGLMLVVQID